MFQNELPVNIPEYLDGKPDFGENVTIHPGKTEEISNLQGDQGVLNGTINTWRFSTSKGEVVVGYTSSPGLDRFHSESDPGKRYTKSVLEYFNLDPNNTIGLRVAHEDNILVIDIEPVVPDTTFDAAVSFGEKNKKPTGLTLAPADW